MNYFKQKICLDGVWNLYIAQNKDCKSFAQDVSNQKQLKKRGISRIDGTVPGNFELDMQKAGLIGDLYYDTDTLLAQQLENLHLWYATEFDMKEDTAGDWYFLFDGVDTCAEYWLNGKKIGATDNMFISHEIHFNNLKKGKNELVVHILPTMLEARKNVFDMGFASIQPSSGIRKSPSMFGWDIMPRIVSGGIWKSVFLCKSKENRINYMHIYRNNKEIAGYTALYYSLSVDNDNLSDYKLEITGECGDDSKIHQIRTFSHTEGVLHGCTIENPKLWWPNSMGKPNLYKFNYKLWYKDTLCDEYDEKVGLRIVELKRTDVIDENGEGDFCFYINGERFFAYGTNWVPLDAYPSRHTKRLNKALDLLEESKSNIVRCWGGNVYENDEFYDFCDEHGITVWQDFAMACQNYPQDSDFAEKLRKEAQSVVKRLRHHACIILWAGDNEVDSCFFNLKDPNDNVLTRNVLPKVISDCDIDRPYLPSSPYISPYAYKNNMANRIPEDHLWGPRKYYKEDYKKNAYARFASEYGYHGCPSPESIKTFLKPENVWPWQGNDGWLVHATSTTLERENNSCAYRVPLMASQVKTLFGETVPDTLEDFAAASQISQSEALKFNIERFRTGKIGWERTGIIWWNLLDGWPQFSDAIIDYYYCEKLAFGTVKRLQNPVCLMFRDPAKKAGDLELCACNEQREDKHIAYKVTDIETDEIILSGESDISANGAQCIASITAPEKQTLLLIEYTVDGVTCKNHYLNAAPIYDFAKGESITDPETGLEDLSPLLLDGTKPFNYNDVVKWFKKAGMFELNGF